VHLGSSKLWVGLERNLGRGDPWPPGVVEVPYASSSPGGQASVVGSHVWEGVPETSVQFSVTVTVFTLPEYAFNFVQPSYLSYVFRNLA
jgi:hypothetical protein